MNKKVFLNLLENILPPTLNQALNTWFLKGMQGLVEVTLTSQTTYVAPFNSDNVFAKLTLGAQNITDLDCTIGDLNEGDEVVFQLTQDGTGARTVAWGSNFEFAGGTGPTVTASTSAIDVFKGVVRGTKILLSVIAQNIS